MPYRRPLDGGKPSAWQHELNTVHKRARARVEHAFARIGRRNILRDCRRERGGVRHATRGIALMHNLAMTG